jgi:16S rRNA processing protein RimM
MKFVPAPFAAIRIRAGHTYAVDPPGNRLVRCIGAREHHDKLLVSFEGFATPEAVRELANCDVFAEASEIELGPGEYLDADLVGLRLLDDRGNDLGTVVGVQHFPAQDCLVVGPQRALVPLIRAFVGTIDLERRTIATTLPDGLLD